MTLLADSIIKTLSYSDYFNYPLTYQELYLRLITPKPINQTIFTQSLNQLLKAHRVIKTQQFYHLPKRQSNVVSRLNKTEISLHQRQLALKLISRVKHMPGVVAIYLTGSLALNNSNLNDDIDLMIITQSGKLWTTRLLVTLYTQLLGVRRSLKSTNFTNKLCLNLYLTPNSFLIPTRLRSLYTAYELIQAQPIFDPLYTHSKLLQDNAWIKTYLANFYSQISHLNNYTPTKTNLRLPTSLIETMAYQLQLFYMKPKITREYITPNSAFFHPHDPSKKLLSQLDL